MASRTIGGSATFVLGLTGAVGSWVNTKTGTHGNFTMLGFTAGLSFGAGSGGMRFSSLSAFNGWSDGWSAGASVGYGAQSIGAGVSHSWNEAGSGTGANFDVGSAGSTGAGAEANWTSTEISNCQSGK